MTRVLVGLFLTVVLVGCGEEEAPPATSEAVPPKIDASAEVRVDAYATVRLTADLTHLNANQQQMVALLIRAADEMNGLFWQQAYGDRDALLSSIEEAPERRFASINYGPWDRLAGNAPFLEGVGAKPLGANFYPRDMSRDEFEAADLADKKSLYTLLQRDEEGRLVTLPYHQAYTEELARTADLLREASELAESGSFAAYLRERARALESDDFQPSDLLWMDMKDNVVDVVIGPIETYEDQLYGHKAAYEGYVLIKDQAWSERLSKFAAFLPELQQNLPVPAAYKAETPGTDSDLNAYDVVFYAGDCNAGSKTIAIIYPMTKQCSLRKVRVACS